MDTLKQKIFLVKKTYEFLKNSRTWDQCPISVVDPFYLKEALHFLLRVSEAALPPAFNVPLLFQSKTSTTCHLRVITGGGLSKRVPNPNSSLLRHSSFQNTKPQFWQDNSKSGSRQPAPFYPFLWRQASPLLQHVEADYISSMGLGDCGNGLCHKIQKIASPQFPYLSLFRDPTHEAIPLEDVEKLLLIGTVKEVPTFLRGHCAEERVWCMSSLLFPWYKR